ncbi:MAG: CooT family nickel-binding protein [Candidatus Syntropharchaeia archaeon]
MCESRVILEKNGDKEVIMEEAMFVREIDGRVEIRNLFGETKNVENAKIFLIDMNTHEIYLESI